MRDDVDSVPPLCGRDLRGVDWSFVLRFCIGRAYRRFVLEVCCEMGLVAKREQRWGLAARPYLISFYFPKITGCPRQICPRGGRPLPIGIVGVTAKK
jgi:hypothetical protein